MRANFSGSLDGTLALATRCCKNLEEKCCFIVVVLIVGNVNNVHTCFCLIV